MFFSKNNKSSKGSKHIELKYLTVRDLVKNEGIMVEHIDATNMLVDPLTKGLRPITFRTHVFSMGIVESVVVLGVMYLSCDILHLLNHIDIQYSHLAMDFIVHKSGVLSRMVYLKNNTI